MKPFDIELAKAGHRVCTRDGKPARIICFDRRSVNGCSIVALIDEASTRIFFHTIYKVDFMKIQGMKMTFSWLL